MHVITRKRLNEFVERHPAAYSSVEEWYRKAKHANWKTFSDIRSTFRTADQVGRFTVFNVGGNKFRIIAVVQYNRQKLYIRLCLTHAEYDENKWKD